MASYTPLWKYRRLRRRVAALEALHRPPVLWSNTHETGTEFDKWRQSPSGSVTAERSSEQAHTGTHSAKLTVHDSGGIRMAVDNQTGTAKTDPHNLPDDGTYSVWFYFPAPITDTNAFQFKYAEQDAPDHQTRRLLYFFRADWTPDGFQWHLRDKLNRDTGEWNDTGQTQTVAKSPLRVPLNTWSQLRVRYRWGKNKTGLIVAWQDGVEIMRVENIWTELDVPWLGYPRQWTVNNYNTHGPNSLYIDDAEIVAV